MSRYSHYTTSRRPCKAPLVVNDIMAVAVVPAG